MTSRLKPSMEDYDFKNLQRAGLQKRWRDLENEDDWESILQLTTERLNFLYEDFKEQGITDLKKEEALTRVFVANTICACHSLLKLITTLNEDVFTEFGGIEALKLEERINKLEAKVDERSHLNDSLNS